MNHGPLQDNELDFIGTMLEKYGNEESILNVSDLDGFLTAIVSGPSTILPSTWLPALWGGEDLAPEWESEEEAKRFTLLVIQHMNDIAGTLSYSPEDYQPLFMTAESEAGSLVFAGLWCSGYLRGVDLGDWPMLPPELESSMDLIAQQAEQDPEALLASASEADTDSAAEELTRAARQLHAYWLAQRSQPQRRQAPKVGRNDPCPCGSGKKYKQCCLH